MIDNFLNFLKINRFLRENVLLLVLYFFLIIIKFFSVYFIEDI